MCIAILNTPNNILPFDTIESSLYSNPDGFGLIATDRGKLIIQKSMSINPDKIYGIYLKHREDLPDSNIVLHFRIATAGKVNIENCHPFQVRPDLAFVHNGIIGQGSRKHSDTYLFNETLKKLPSSFLSNSGTVDLIKRSIGASKLVFLSDMNEATIINEDMGHSDTFGNWYSNRSYQQYKFSIQKELDHSFAESCIWCDPYTPDGSNYVCKSCEYWLTEEKRYARR
jgi:predicted glutamine amidotransferase